jgi:hypothetical protein
VPRTGPNKVDVSSRLCLLKIEARIHWADELSSASLALALTEVYNLPNYNSLILHPSTLSSEITKNRTKNECMRRAAPSTQKQRAQHPCSSYKTATKIASELRICV